MSLYKYLTIDVLKKVIGGSIRFTQPGAFNDPFEMLPELHVPAELTNSRQTIEFDVVAPRRAPPIGELATDFKSDRCSDLQSRNIRASLDGLIGVLCLSKTQQSLLMWSHYADEYAGAVIEFDEEHDFFCGKIDVEYRTSRPINDISAYITAGEAMPVAELCVKSVQWEYEEEVRLARQLSDCRKVIEKDGFPVYVMDIPQDCIKSIILGERTSRKSQKEIWDLIKETNIALSLAAIANWEYDFRLERIKWDKPFPQVNPIISPRTAHIFEELSCPVGEAARWATKSHPMSGVVNKTA